MKKNALGLMVLLLPTAFTGCSQTMPTKGGYSAAPQTSSQPALGEQAAPATLGGTNQPITFSRGDAPAKLPRRDKSYFGDDGYTNEKESVNYMVTQSGHLSKDADRRPAIEREHLSPADKFLAAKLEPVSTFSADVDTASYSNVRRYLQQSSLPPAELVRVEEMVNYFHYQLPDPKGKDPFSVTTELSPSPWARDTQLLRVAVKTKAIDRGQVPPRNLVFLLDVSGSMCTEDKLPLLKKSLRKLVDTLDDADKVAIVVYAGASGVVLPPTSGDQKPTILEAIEDLSAGGSTNGSSGIQLAYELAEQGMDDNSVNRVILATDGDFNVGPSSPEALKSLIEEKRKSGIFLSVLGFGEQGNDKTMETLADNGNGNYASIDSLNEAEKVLVQEAGANLVTVAKDVKFQVAFDPHVVESYRLIGYENRRLANRDFEDDTKDAGEVGAGHAVTALYELKLAQPDPDMKLLQMANLMKLPKLATVKIRYKQPDADESVLMETSVSGATSAAHNPSLDQQWAAGVTSFALRLRGELDDKQISTEQIVALLQPVMKSEPDAYQAEFYSMVKKAEPLLKAE